MPLGTGASPRPSSHPSARPVESSVHTPDETLCLRYRQNGDNQHAETLLQRYATLIRRLSVRLASLEPCGTGQAEDIEGVMRWALVEAMERYRPDRVATFRTFVCAVLVNAGKDFLRLERSQRSRCDCFLDAFLTDEERDLYLSRYGADDTASSSSAETPFGIVAHQETVAALLIGLSPKDRAAAAVLLEGGSEADIMDACRCTRGAAHVRRSRVLEKLRRHSQSFFKEDVTIRGAARV